MILLPPPSDPRLLVRVCVRVGAGVRRTRALAEQLDVEPVLVERAVDAGEWLGLLHRGPPLVLTSAGMEVVFGAAGRVRGYTAVLAEHPWRRELGDEVLRTLDLLRIEVRRRVPGLEEERVEWHARAVASLFGPAARVRRRRGEGQQLALEFGSAVAPRSTGVDLRAGTDDNPDVYALVLRALLDRGELSTPQLRAVLDRAGGQACGLGGYLAMAVRRGDATRVGDVLVATAGAADRADLADSGVTVALSDPDFRALLGGASGPAARFRPWLRRLFPWVEEATLLRDPAALRAALDRLLLGRSLASVTPAGDPGPPLPRLPERPTAFLEACLDGALTFSLPSDLSTLAAGLAGINRALRAAAQGAAEVRAPSAVDRRVWVHGGLVAPGEALPRTIPDGVSLRLRAVETVPAFALLVALGALSRAGRMRLEATDAAVRVVGRGWRLDLGEVVGLVAETEGWVLLSSADSASWPVLVELAEELGLLARVGERVTLDEAFFARLESDAEHHPVWGRVLPLAERVAQVFPKARSRGA